MLKVNSVFARPFRQQPCTQKEIPDGVSGSDDKRPKHQLLQGVENFISCSSSAAYSSSPPAWRLLVLLMVTLTLVTVKMASELASVGTITRWNSDSALDAANTGVRAKSKNIAAFEPSSKAHVCGAEMKWDAYHHLESFTKNMHAHYKEDWQVSTYFENLCGGTYLELGGFDGSQYSNSYAFHKGLNWTGVLIEASPKNYPLMVKNRPNELATIHSGICSQERDLHFVSKESIVGAVSGFVEFAAESFKKTWWSEADIRNAQVVKCRSLTSNLLEAVGPNFHFDFFSLDVEGAEYEVLLSLDFDLFSFGVIFVEADGHNPQKNSDVKKILESKGYVFTGNTRNSDWFINKNFDNIYKGLIENKNKKA